MDIDSAKLIYFSPTGTTKIIVDAIVGGIRADAAGVIDLTSPGSETEVFDRLDSELAIIGAPVYSGRIPLEAIARLKRIRANNTPAVLVVLYGNREYDDALLELKDLAVEAGFIPVAGGAFIGEHSFSNENTPIATGRPDTKDLEKAERFGAQIRNKLRDIRGVDEITPLQVPGKYPHRKRMQPTNTSPITMESLCTTCGTCAGVCPTAAVAVNDSVETDPVLCIICCACIKNCPNRARVIKEPRVKQIAEWVYKNNSARKEPEVYL